MEMEKIPQMEWNALDAILRNAERRKKSNAVGRAPHAGRTPSTSHFNPPSSSPSHSRAKKRPLPSSWSARNGFRRPSSHAGQHPRGRPGSPRGSSATAHHQPPPRKPGGGGGGGGTRVVECSLDSPDKFIVKTSMFSGLDSIFSNLSGVRDSAKSWSFPLSAYADVVSAAHAAGADVHPLPSRVVRFVVEGDDRFVHDANPDLSLRIPPSLFDALMPYQKDGVAYAVQRNGRVLIGDEMGLGKTVQAIAIASYYRHDWPVLVICPSSLRDSWKKEFIKWLRLSSQDIHVIRSGKDCIGKTGALITVISYDLATTQSHRLSGFKFVIADESHSLKNFKAKRTRVLKPLIQACRRRVLLTGTPALSRPNELYPQLECLDPHHVFFPTHHEFGMRYCNGFMNAPWGWNYEGASNTKELHVLLERTLMIRRLKSFALSQLPEKRRHQVDVKLLKTHAHQITGIVREMKTLRNSSTLNPDDARFERLRLMMELLRQTGAAKTPAVLEFIEEQLRHPDTHKLLVFANHHTIIDAISGMLQSPGARAEFGEHVVIDGRTPGKTRQRLVDIFQTREDYRVAVLGIRSAGVGLTMTAANRVVFAELWWNPGHLRQAEDRAHRIGQTRPVDVFYLTSKGTIDELVWDLIIRKLRILGTTLNGEAGSLDTDKMSSTADPSRVDPGLVEHVFSGIESYDERRLEYHERRERRKTLEQHMKEIEGVGGDVHAFLLRDDDDGGDDDGDGDVCAGGKRVWEDMRVPQLKKALKERGLKVGGRKRELIERLNEYEMEGEKDMLVGMVMEQRNRGGDKKRRDVLQTGVLGGMMMEQCDGGSSSLDEADKPVPATAKGEGHHSLAASSSEDSEMVEYQRLMKLKEAGKLNNGKDKLRLMRLRKRCETHR